MVLDLKTQLQQTKDAARVAREAAEAVVKVSYERGVCDTEARLTEEVVVVCKDYCTKSWGVAMDRAGVLVDYEFRIRQESLQITSLGGLRISSSQRIFERFLTRTLLPRSSFLPRLPSLTLTLLRGKEWTRKLNNRRRTSHSRTPS